MMMGRIIAISDVACTSSGRGPYWKLKTWTPTEIGWRSGLLTGTGTARKVVPGKDKVEYRNSDNGGPGLRNDHAVSTLKGPAPSIIAASSRSFGQRHEILAQQKDIVGVGEKVRNDQWQKVPVQPMLA